MKRRTMLSFLGLSVALVGAVGASALQDTAAQAKKGAAIGEKAPAFTLKDINGAEHKFSDHAGKIIVLEWVNPECPVCRGAHEDGRITNMYKEIKAMDNVVFFAINSTNGMTAERNQEALKHYGVDYTVLVDADGSVGKLYGARTTPHIFVIDTTGVLRYQGALDNVGGPKVKEGFEVINYPLGAIKQIKAGETVSPETTRPYGCAVKYAQK